MIEQVKDALVDNASVLTRGMAQANPFVAFLLIVVVVLLGWLLWDNHRLQRDLVGIKLSDLEQSHTRANQIDKFTSMLLEMEKQDTLDREMFTSYLEVNILLEEYRCEHNEVRPHSALRDRTPDERLAEWGLAYASSSVAPQGQAPSGRRFATLDRPHSTTQELAAPERTGLSGQSQIKPGLS